MILRSLGSAFFARTLLLTLAFAVAAPAALHASLPGEVVAWGWDQYGQSTVPPEAMTDIVDVAQRTTHTLALKSDGTVLAWGDDSHGETEVPPGLTDVVALALGEAHCLALRSNGEVVAWGARGFDRGQATVPPEAQSGIVAIGAGFDQSLAVKSDGTVIAWGGNDWGQCNVPAGLADVVAVTGSGASFAVKRDGTVVAWGSNSFGEADVPYGLKDVIAIAAIDAHVIALKSDGTMLAWGKFFNGYSFVPFSVPDGVHGVKAFATGVAHAIALLEDGTIFGFGANDQGQLNTPPDLTGIDHVSAGYLNSAAILGHATRAYNRAPIANAGPDRQVGAGYLVKLDGALSFDRDRDPLTYQWTQTSGPIVALDVTDPRRPTFTAPAVVGATLTFELEVSDGAASAVDQVVVTTIDIGAPPPEGSIQVVAWGSNSQGEGALPPAAQDHIVELAANHWHVVALKNDGTVIAWGYNGYGQTEVPAGLTDVVSVATGDTHALALRSNGQVVAWGARGYDRGQATVPPEAQSGVIAIAAGLAHSLALKADGTVIAWGGNDTGGLDVPPGLHDVIAIAASGGSLALKRDGTVVGWGTNGLGEVSIPAGLTNVVSIATSDGHSLALTCDGTLIGWGRIFNSVAFENYGVPPEVRHVKAFGAGVMHTIALLEDGTFAAWGRPDEGQLLVPSGLTGVDQLAAGFTNSLALVGHAPRALNRPPVANAGADFSAAAGFTARLSGCLSFDRDRDPLTYQWTQLSGPAVTLDLADPEHPVFTAPTVIGATLNFRLTVSDGRASSSDEVSLTTYDAGQPPTPGAIFENFNSNTLPAGFETQGPGMTFQNGMAVNVPPTRSYCRTIDGGYYNRSFVAEVTCLMDEIAFFGIGTGELNPNFFDEPAAPSINLRIHPTNVAGGRADAGDNVVDFASPLNTFGNPGSGTHRLRLIWDAVAKTATFQIHQNYTGGPFVATFTSPPVYGGDNGFDGTNAHVFFGGQTFDDFYLIETTGSLTANAGADFGVNEGGLVTLDGTGSMGPASLGLTYSWAQLAGGTAVTLSGANTATPSFTAPSVAPGGETLSFVLTITAGDQVSVDTVSVTVVNVNHTPVAFAGVDQSVAEGSPVTLHGELSFDPDHDSLGYAWTQVSGPVVTLADADSANPSFVAPILGTNGAPGVVATLVFELRVDDGLPPDAPAPGYPFSAVADRVTISVTNTNHAPVARAGADRTANEGSAVVLSDAGSTDADGDSLTYAWAQTSGPAVALSGANSATVSFTAPAVNAGGAVLEFELTVSDSFGGSARDRVLVQVQNINDPPNTAGARPSVAVLWPPNHQLISVGITGITDPGNDVTVAITSVTQDEPTSGGGGGDTPIDAIIQSNGAVLLRSERNGTGDGRVYRIAFTASNPTSSSSGVVYVSVPHSANKAAINSGTIYQSTH